MALHSCVKLPSASPVHKSVTVVACALTLQASKARLALTAPDAFLFSKRAAVAPPANGLA